MPTRSPTCLASPSIAIGEFLLAMLSRTAAWLATWQTVGCLAILAWTAAVPRMATSGSDAAGLYGLAISASVLLVVGTRDDPRPIRLALAAMAPIVLLAGVIAMAWIGLGGARTLHGAA